MTSLPTERAPFASGRARSLAAVLVLAALSAFTVLSTRPPRSAELLTRGHTFAAQSALARVSTLVSEPRYVGSPHHDRARDELVRSLRELGLDTEVQHTTAINGAWGMPAFAGRVQNVIGRLPGRASSGALLLSAHYDTVPTSRGVADNGAGVAVLLEVLATLRNRKPLDNDLIVLFTDGEESGLTGMQAFLDEHALAKQVRFVANLDARGVRGPALMFETSPNNSAIVDSLVARLPFVVANSFMQTVYEHMPNGTDFSVVRQRGLAGINLAFIEGSEHYHTRLDEQRALDQDTLSHMGAYVNETLERAGRTKLDSLRSDHDAVYFDLANRFISYPFGLALPLALLGVAGYWLLLVREQRASAFTWPQLARLVGMAFAAVVGTPVLVLGGWFALLQLFPDYRAFHFSAPHDSGPWGWVVVALVTALHCGVLRRFGRKASSTQLWLACLAPWLLLSLVTSLAFPGASYAFTWPLLGALVALAWQGPARARLRFALAAAVPGALLTGKMAYLVHQGLALSGSALLALFVSLLLLLIVPLPLAVAGVWGRASWLVPALAAFSLATTTRVANAYGAERPRPNNLFYVEDHANARAQWVTFTPANDSWLKPRFGSDTQPCSPRDFGVAWWPFDGRCAPAPQLHLAVPQATLLSERREGSTRKLSVRVSSSRQAPVVAIALPDRGRVVSATLQGKPVVAQNVAPNVPWSVVFWGVPDDGLRLELELRGTGALDLHVVDQAFDLDTRIGKRPNEFLSLPALILFDSSLSHQLFRL